MPDINENVNLHLNNDATLLPGASDDTPMLPARGRPVFHPTDNQNKMPEPPNDNDTDVFYNI